MVRRGAGEGCGSGSPSAKGQTGRRLRGGRDAPVPNHDPTRVLAVGASPLCTGRTTTTLGIPCAGRSPPPVRLVVAPFGRSESAHPEGQRAFRRRPDSHAPGKDRGGVLGRLYAHGETTYRIAPWSERRRKLQYGQVGDPQDQAVARCSAPEVFFPKRLNEKRGSVNESRTPTCLGLPFVGKRALTDLERRRGERRLAGRGGVGPDRLAGRVNSSWNPGRNR